ncbi:Sm-like protein lsm7 [Penicillium riverlandense]|uniref:Sm-like protein lsm7 n=1 Tax=Penicillium riverlandense TaxID=1903569 RepID=UPI002546759D|nr:Sm-like protein lsm7 [Penicillium riverlandense]KAJ5819370.1 Sm-like protein lsm7 [Penicillium riverlandense]
MSERGSFRGGRGGGRGGPRGQQGSQQKSGGGGGAQEKPKRKTSSTSTSTWIRRSRKRFTNLLFAVSGILKGYDQLMNLVLDDVKESMRDDEGNQTTRSLGLIVARGTLIVLISPADGSEEIANPFVQPEE